MKKRILTHLMTAAAGIALPLSVVGQDFGNETNSGQLSGGTTSSEPSGQTSPATGSYSSGGTFSGESPQSSDKKSGGFVGGIIVHDGAAYVVHRLQNEMTLPDGSKVEPNGTVIEKDGSMRSIGSGHALSMDGRVVSTPFDSGSKTMNSGEPSEGVYSSPNTPGSTTGIGDSTDSIKSQDMGNSPSTPPATSAPSENLGGSSSSPGSPSPESGATTGDISQPANSGSSSGSIGTDSSQY